MTCPVMTRQIISFVDYEGLRRDYEIEVGGVEWFGAMSDVSSGKS